MATVITSECINCGACEPECPNTAIYQGGVEWQATDGSMRPAISNDIFYIVPEKCTECVGFFDQEACAAVCPVDCCVPDPQRPESEAALLERARALHPDKTIPDDAPSRFKKDGAAPAAAAGNGQAGAAVSAPAAAAPHRPHRRPRRRWRPGLRPSSAVGSRRRSPGPPRRVRRAPSRASCRSTSISSWPSSGRRAAVGGRARRALVSCCSPLDRAFSERSRRG